MQASQDGIRRFYAVSSKGWTEPGGFVISSLRVPGEPDWDTTTRSGYIGAKVNPGKVAYAEPYIAPNTGDLTTGLSTIITDMETRELGIIPGNGSIAFLPELTAGYASVPDQETYFFNKQGLFIIPSDEDAGLQKDFFTEFGLEAYRDPVIGLNAVSNTFSLLDKVNFIYGVFVPGPDWILLTKVPQGLIFGETNRIIFIIIALALGLVLGLSLISIILIRGFARPLQPVEALSGHIFQGDFSGTAPEYPIRETGLLAEGFNAIHANIGTLVNHMVRSFERPIFFEVRK
jgi:methyl-accepting chemotaxis protein